MISNIDQLKSLINWCKDAKIKKLKLKDIEFEISELDFLPDDGKQITLDNYNLSDNNTETLVDTLDDNSDVKNDPDLFWSSST